MNTSNLISGVYTALATPFQKDGELDWKAFERLIEKQINGGVDGVVVSGSTGESPTLSVTEKLSMIRKCYALAKGRIKVMAGTGSSCTKQSVELSKLAEDAGAESLLVVTPPYNKPSLEGLKVHYKKIADAVTIPICLYHVPSRTGQLLNAEQLTALTSISGVVAVKEASSDLALFSKARAISQAHFLSGDDNIYLPTLAVGGSGVISVVSNVFPRALVDLGKSFNQGDFQRANRIHDILFPFISAMFLESNPCPLKVALALEGIMEETVRSPLAPVSDATRKVVHDAYRKAKDELKSLSID